MKKFLVFLSILLIFEPTPKVVQANSESVYAKVLDECLLYKTNDTDLILSSNVYFTIPKGYFVTIIANITSETVKVKYGSFTGFVKSDKIRQVSCAPQSPTLTGVTFDIKESSSTQIRSSPNTDSQDNILHIIPSSTKNITYIASTFGEIPPSGSSNIWYFVEYSPESDPVSVYYGYVYSEKTENLSPIIENTELENELVDTPTTAQKHEEYIELSSGVKALLLIIISLPILVIFLIILFSQKKSGISKFTKKIFSHKKPQNVAEKIENEPIFPTYEFDDDDLL